jgi:glucosamine-6-phosphate deaminase
MSTAIPEYLHVPKQELGQGTLVDVQVRGGAQELAHDMAQSMLDEITEADRNARNATLILPVGPVDQFPILADMINRQGVDCRNVMLINMDEYLTDEDRWIDLDHPLSFRGYMNRLFYERLEPELAPVPENRVFPDPQDVDGVQKVIQERGGVDVVFGGIGINGHIAFNEPVDGMANDEFAGLSTRCLDLTPHTRTINANTVGGDISIIPRRAVTVGMKEILSARRLRFYCNRPWQSAVVRRLLACPVTSSCPASFLRTHPDARLVLTDQVADPPQIQLR